MALKHRILRLEARIRPNTESGVMIVSKCSCGKTDPEAPPEFNGLVICITGSGLKSCSHGALVEPANEAENGG